MLFAAFKSLSVQLIVIFALIAVCALIAWVHDGRAGAVALVQISVVGMKGPWVWAFGYGLAMFITDRGRALAAALNGILEPSDATAEMTARIERSTLHRSAWMYTVPVTLLGVFLTRAYAWPLGPAGAGVSHFPKNSTPAKLGKQAGGGALEGDGRALV